MARPIKATDLPADVARIAEAQVAAGRFASIEEVVRAGILAVKREQEKLDALRAALEEGEASGVAADSSLEGILAEFRARRAP